MNYAVCELMAASNMLELFIFSNFLNLLIKNYASNREISAEATKGLRSLVAWTILFVYIPSVAQKLFLEFGR